MKKNIIKEKSFAFSLRIILLTRELRNRKVESVLINQILKSGTARCANVEEAIGCCSTRDFIAKFSIVYKEARETHYWHRLLRDSGYINEKQAESLLSDCERLLRIIGSIQKTLKSNQNIRNP